VNLIDAKIELTMTSRDVAVAVGSPHDSVLKTVRRLIAEGVVFGNEAPYVHPQNGQTYAEFHLNYRDTMIVASGYSAKLRARVIDRWLELERMARPVRPELPQTFAQALRLAAEQAEVIEQQQAALAEAAPKIEFAEAVRNVDGLCTFEQIAKSLGIGRNKMIAQLKADEVLQANRMPYQRYIDRGYFEVIEQTPWTDSQGATHPCFSTRVTGAGQVWLARRFAKVDASVVHH
jgi:phage antirepressor YoqD-like protein